MASGAQGCPTADRQQEVGHLHPTSAQIRILPSNFPGGAVVKNPPANAGDTGLSPGPGRSHVPQSN